MDKIKTIVIVSLLAVVVIMFGVIVELKRTYRMREYAIANNCTWSWTGSMYGDDRDYICK